MTIPNEYRRVIVGTLIKRSRLQTARELLEKGKVLLVEVIHDFVYGYVCSSRSKHVVHIPVIRSDGEFLCSCEHGFIGNDTFFCAHIVAMVLSEQAKEIGTFIRACLVNKGILEEN